MLAMAASISARRELPDRTPRPVVITGRLSQITNRSTARNLSGCQHGCATTQIIREIKDLENEGFQFEGAEASLELLLHKAFGQYKDFFQLVNLKIMVEKREDNGMASEAIIKIKVNDQVVHTAAEGDGPVNALDNALRKALADFFPTVEQMHLSDYKVRVLDGTAGTSATVRVLIESTCGTERWSTVGVSENIIEASWQALVDSVSYMLLKERQKQNANC